jgi:aspartate/methionine/tyrosine aminotransferase
MLFPMHELATELENILKDTIIDRLLSELGHSLYFPKGIVAQSAEADEQASRYNATVGMATLQGKPISLPCMQTLVPSLESTEVFSYAPTAGIKNLRTLWKKELVEKNPDLAGSQLSLPLVTTGVTHGIALAADLFADSGDCVLIAEPFWDNYKLIFEVKKKAKLFTYPFFLGQRLNLEAVEEFLTALKSGKVILIFNFPHNPTGYSPTIEEAHALKEIILKSARRGLKLAVLVDDAYFGLFYEETTFKQSVFSLLANLHENILAIKLDGATKEDLSWGLRLGFITFASKDLQERHYQALEKKTMGALRSSVSNCPRLSQTMLIKAMTDPHYQAEKAEAFSLLKERYLAVKKILAPKSEGPLIPLPFNSGYFFTFQCKHLDAEKLRTHLLHERGIGTIAVSPRLLRIAYSSIDSDKIEDFFKELWQAAEYLAGKNAL